MFLRLAKTFSIIIFLTALTLSCGSRDLSGDNYTKLLHGCIEDSEIQQLDQLFSFFEQRMQSKYNCKNTKECLLRYVYETAEGNYYDEKMSITEEEKKLIKQYIASRDFAEHWLTFEKDSINDVRFFPKFVYKDCYVKPDAKLSSLFRSMGLMGSIPHPHEIAFGFIDMLEEGTKLDDSIGLSIFIYVYLFELFNWQIENIDVG